MKRYLSIFFTIMFFVIGSSHAGVVQSYDDMNECTIIAPSEDVRTHTMREENGRGLDYQFGVKFIKFNSKSSPKVIIFFQVLRNTFGCYTNYIKIKTKSGKLYTVKVDDNYRTSLFGGRIKPYGSSATISADDYKKYFLHDIPVKIQVSLEETLQLNVGPRQIKGLTQMANYFKETF